MKKSIKKLGAVVLTAAMVGSLAACGGGGDTTTTTTAAPTETTAAAAGGSEETTAAAAEETTAAEAEAPAYDFGGQVVKVYGGDWNNLDPAKAEDSTVDVSLYTDAEKQVEEKYNIDLVYTEPGGDTGYNLDELIISSMTAGEGVVDILESTPDAIISMIGADVLADITDTYNELELGKLYTDAATWNDHVYGVTFDNVGDVYMLVYSRKYLEDIGMTETPTEKFMKGEWSFDDMKEYLTEMKSKLPDGMYPIATHYFHWACMAGSANGGVPSVSSNGTIGFTDPNYIEAMEFYKELIDLGLAAPITLEFDEDDNLTGEDLMYGTGGLNQDYVMTMAEMWQTSGLSDSIGDWGIVFWPWGDSVTCDGDYTTLSDNYKLAQAYWGPTVVLKDASARTGIDDITLFQIAKDFNELIDPTGVASMHAAWESEQAGQTPTIGFSAGTARNFCTEEDIELYDWAHARVLYDWAKPFDDSGVVDTWSNMAKIIAGRDARSTGESNANAGYANMKELGIVQ